MKNLLALCISGLLLTGCFLVAEPDYNWKPPALVGNVDCCITDVQVHGAIYSALLKLKWPVKEKTENGFVAEMPCEINDRPIMVFFENTDKDYMIAPEQEVFNIYEARHCIENNVEKIDRYIEKYLNKAMKIAAKRAASNELKGIK